ncbi:protein kinase [Candidatus Bathyarchaeota archaeon]|nr:protein kinase [Candidatus Bathyarchaeota archaeon]
MTIKCPKCDTDNPSDSKFCKECAAPIKLPKDVSVTKTLKTPFRGFKKDTIIAKKYKIIEMLGEGGMGIVYKAKDTRLKRTVALKFLPAELTKDKEAKKRFVQEAQAAAALEHPNICIVHEVDEADEQTFISMSYIEGQNLKAMLKDGPLDVDEAKDIAIQVAEGLREAHEKGIVHRDIKPANIMLTKKGQAKITDFGLAKLSWGVDLTKTSTIVGTVAYMSPEQARGEEVDHRTDIWSLGAMLYEMLTGKRPFEKDQEHALIYSILNEDPVPINSLRSDIPGHIEKVIRKALEKDASKRYPDILELIQGLKLPPLITFPKTQKSIVVLPFENLSPDPEQEYFCDGMTEEIITDLSKIQSLRVISRNSAMMFKGSRKATKTIGRELDVQFVLEGSVRKAGNKLRIIAQLIDAASDAHIWAEKYSGTLDDVFDIQEKVSCSIADALKLRLTSEEKRKIAEQPISDIEAYECYLKAVSTSARFTEEAMNDALRYFQHALDAVGDNALLYSGIAYTHVCLMNIGVDLEENRKKAEEFVQKALGLDPEIPKAHAVLGLLNMWYRGTKKDLKEAIFHLKKALVANPNEHQALVGLSIIYLYAGKPDPIVPLIVKLKKIEPLDMWTFFFAGMLHYVTGQSELALQEWRRAYEIDTKNPSWQHWYARALIGTGQDDEAFAIIEQGAQATPNHVHTKLALMLKHGLQGDKDKAVQEMSPDFQEWCRREAGWSSFIADSFALLNEKEEALDWLEHSVNQGYIDYPYFTKKDPYLDNIRGEERFKKLMERVKHEWENFEV